MILFVLFITGLLLILFPGNDLKTLLINQRYIHDTGFRYSILLLAKDNNLPINMEKIKKEPLRVINELQLSDTSENNEDLWLKYIVLKTIAYEPRENKMITLKAEKAVNQYLDYFKTIPTSASQDSQLAQDALAIDRPPLALWFYQRAISKEPNQDMQFYIKAAQTALWAEECKQSADYYFSAQHKAKTINDKRYLFIQAVNLLIGCNYYDLAIQSAEKNLDVLKQDPLTYQLLTDLALKADKPEKAKVFILKLLQIKQKNI